MCHIRGFHVILTIKQSSAVACFSYWGSIVTLGYHSQKLEGILDLNIMIRLEEHGDEIGNELK